MRNRVGWALAVLVALSGCAANPPSEADAGARQRAIGKPVESPGPTPTPRAQELRAPAAAEKTAAAGGPGEKYALVVGVSSYASKGIPQLKFASSDAEAVCARMIDEACLAIPSSHVKLLLDAAATGEAIRDGIRWLNRVATPRDTVFIYFSGHGAIDVGAKGEVGNFLLPHDAKVVTWGGREALDPATGLAIAEVQKELGDNKAQHLLLILDSCFSGAGRSIQARHLDRSEADRSERELQDLSDAAPGRAVLVATAPNQPALEIDRLGHGLFTYFLLEGLNADDNHDGRVTLDEAWSYLSPLVVAEARRLNLEQTPMLKASYKDVFALREVRARHRVRLEVRYDDGAIVLQGRADPPSAPTPVGAARRFDVKVLALEPPPQPLFVYVLKIALSASGARAAMLLPDGENGRAPLVTLARGREAATYPNPLETGSATEPVPAAEANAHVLYVLIASEAEMAAAQVERVEGRLVEAAQGAGPDEMAAAVAQRVLAEPILKQAAVRYAFATQRAREAAR
jgi:uncharacterized caspase-like protein